MTSVSETAVQTYFCPVQQGHGCLARQLRLAWFHFDALGTFAPLVGLHGLISCLTTISLHNHYYSLQVLSARQLSFAIFLRLLGLLRLAPVLCSATCYGSLSYSLKKIRYQHCGSRLYCASPSCVRQLGLANFLRSFVSLSLTPALRSATSSNGSLSYSLE